MTWSPPPADCCGLCSEKLHDGLGTGVLLALGGVPFGKAHQECMMRSVLGGAGHHEDHQFWCLGAGQDTDGGLTYRQSGLRVFAMVQERGVEAMLS